MPNTRWCQVRYEQWVEHAGIHGNPESGNYPGTIKLIESVEILTSSQIYHDQQKGGGGERAKACHKQIQCSKQMHILTELEHNTCQPHKKYWDATCLWVQWVPQWYLLRASHFSNHSFHETVKHITIANTLWAANNFKMHYYSTIMSFHQIRPRERAKYKTVIHCSVLVWPVYNRVKMGNDISLAFCVVYVICTRHILIDSWMDR